VPQAITVEREVGAPPQRIFDLLADPRRHGEIDGSGTLRDVTVEAPERLSAGAEWGVAMKALGLPYKVVNTVAEFEEGRRIAWHHKARVIWRYELEPAAGGTLVRETWDPAGAGAVARAFFTVFRFPQRTRAAMTATLERLAHAVEGPPPPSHPA
jgi:uncharacterized protein YndB with AHSA1/START domain